MLSPRLSLSLSPLGAMHTLSAILFLAAFVLCGLSGCNRPLSQAELKSHFARGGTPNWLFVPGGRIDFDAGTADTIRDWLVTHDTGWISAVSGDFDPAKTQLLTDNSIVEVDGSRLVVTFERVPEDTDTTIDIQRPLSSDERLFWERIIARIKAPNHALQRAEAGGGPSPSP